MSNRSEVAEPSALAPEESTGAQIGHDPLRPGRDDKLNRMGTASVPRLILEFAIPAILGMLVNGAYNLIDRVFLGQAMGDLGLSTATVAMPIMTIFLAIAMLIGSGGNALAALRLGEGSRVDAEKTLGNTFLLSVIVSFIVFVLALTPVVDWLLMLSSATPEVWDSSKIFIQIISCGFIFQCIGMGINNFIRTAGAPNRALLTMLIGAVACTAFNYLFVMVLHLGVMGSALATVCGQAVSCVSVLWYFVFTKNVPLKLHFCYMRLELGIVGKIFALGAASFFVQAAASVVNFVVNAMLVTYGSQSPVGAEGALASIGVVSSIAMFVVLPLIGVAIAVQPLLGYNYGAHNYYRVKQTLRDGIIGVTILGIVAWALVHIFAYPIVGLFGVPDHLHDFTVKALGIQLALMPFIGFQIVGSNYFQATGQPLKSIFLSTTRQVLFLIPLYLLLPVYLPQWFPGLTGLDAVYYAPPVSDFLAVFTTLVFIIWELKRLAKLEAGEIEAEY